jgi:hypothetical protein
VSGDAEGTYVNSAVRDEGYVSRFTPERDVPIPGSLIYGRFRSKNVDLCGKFEVSSFGYQ